MFALPRSLPRFPAFFLFVSAFVEFHWEHGADESSHPENPLIQTEKAFFITSTKTAIAAPIVTRVQRTLVSPRKTAVSLRQCPRELPRPP